MILPLLLALLAVGDPTIAPAAPAPAAADEALELTLEDAIQLALDHNLSIEGARLDAQSALEGFGSAWGAFDTVFFSSASYRDGKSAPSPSNTVGGVEVGGSPATKNTLTQWRTGFRGMFLSGTSWSLDAGPRRQQTSNSQFESDVYTGDWGLTVSHPLLRAGADDYARTALERSRQDALVASLSAEQVANDTLQTVTTAYWLFVFTRQDRKTRELSVDLAQELLDITGRKFEQGLQNRINVTEVEAELATRREELLQARNAERDAEDQLRRLVLAPSERADWDRPIVPLTEPSPPAAVAPDLNESIDMAIAWRADVARARELLRRADIDVTRAESESLPLLDLTGSYGANANKKTYGQVYGALDDTRYDTRTVALNFEVPFGNRGAGYRLRQAEVQRQRAGVDLRDAELTAVSEVRAAVRQVQLQIERVAATAETVRLQQAVYDGEVKRLENDLSTPFQVRQSQRDLLSAIDTETRARLDLEVARAGLLASQGRLLYVSGRERSLPEMPLDEAPPAP